MSQGGKGETMVKTVNGKVHGRVIELNEDLGLPEGQEVEVQIKVVTLRKKLPGPPSGWQPGVPSKTAGLLAESWTEDDDRILEEIAKDRKRETRE